MNATALDARRSSSSAALQTIGAAGLVCGVLDIAYVFVVFGWRDGRAARILQGIAVSLLGPAATTGGTATAAFGLLIHFGVALAAGGALLCAQPAPALAGHAAVDRRSRLRRGLLPAHEPRGPASHPPPVRAVPSARLDVGAGRPRALRGMADRVGHGADDPRPRLSPRAGGALPHRYGARLDDSRYFAAPPKLPDTFTCTA